MGCSAATLHAHETTEPSAGQGTGRTGCDGDTASAHVRATSRWCHIESRITVEQMPLCGRCHKRTGHRNRMLLHLQCADDDGLAIVVAAHLEGGLVSISISESKRVCEERCV